MEPLKKIYNTENWSLIYLSLLKDISKEFPKFKIRLFSENLFLNVLSHLGFFKNVSAMTMGNTIYVCDDFHNKKSSTKAITLAHEREHLDQIKVYGTFLFYFLYLFTLPVFFTFRAKFEKEAYTVDLVNFFHEDPDIESIDSELLRMIDIFTGSSYLYMSLNKENIKSWFWDLA